MSLPVLATWNARKCYVYTACAERRFDPRTTSGLQSVFAKCFVAWCICLRACYAVSGTETTGAMLLCSCQAAAVHALGEAALPIRLCSTLSGTQIDFAGTTGLCTCYDMSGAQIGCYIPSVMCKSAVSICSQGDAPALQTLLHVLLAPPFHQTQTTSHHDQDRAQKRSLEGREDEEEERARVSKAALDAMERVAARGG
eukprot:597346-Rhodomonas_salina.1